MISISFIVPSFNDEKDIKNKLKILEMKLSKNKINFEIIVVNDGSSDKTQIQIRSINSKKINLLNNYTNRGKSFSIRRALKQCKYKNIIMIDSDLPYFNKIDYLIKNLEKGYDFIYIDRRNPKSKILDGEKTIYKIFRNLMSNFISMILSKLLKLSEKKVDSQAGLKAFKIVKHFNQNNFISEKFFLDIELMFFFSKEKKKILSVPVNYKISDRSSIKILNLLGNLEILLELVKVLIYLIYKKISNKN